MIALFRAGFNGVVWFGELIAAWLNIFGITWRAPACVTYSLRAARVGVETIALQATTEPMCAFYSGSSTTASLAARPPTSRYIGPRHQEVLWCVQWTIRAEPMCVR